MMSDQAYIEELNDRLSGSSAEVILRELLMEFGDRIIFSSSLGAEDQVMTALLAGIDKSARIFTLDTGRMFPETYEL